MRRASGNRPRLSSARRFSSRHVMAGDPVSRPVGYWKSARDVMGSSQQTFLSHLDPRSRARFAAVPNLEAQLDELWSSAVAGCSGVALSPERFLGHIAACIEDAEDPRQAIRGLHGADLY